MTKAFIAGFMSKCAEAGLSQKQAVALLAKEAADAAPVAPAVAAAGAGKTVKKPFSNGGVSPGTIAGDAKMVGAVNNAVSQIFPRGGSIHTPITHKDVGNAINFASANGLKGDPNLKMNKPMVDMLLQQKVDTLPDPGPGVRNPTPYEVSNLWYELMRHGYNENEKPLQNLLTAWHGNGRSFLDGITDGSAGPYSDVVDYAQSPWASSFIRGIPAADPKIQNELIRRSWNAATSAVPISATSPTPIR